VSTVLGVGGGATNYELLTLLLCSSRILTHWPIHYLTCTLHYHGSMLLLTILSMLLLPLWLRGMLPRMCWLLLVTTLIIYYG